MKKCNKCKQEKPLTEYYKSKQSKDGHQNSCKICGAKSASNHYKNNKEKKKKRTLITNKKLKQRNYTFIARYLSLFGECVDCGNKDIRVLEFDHKEQSNKVEGVKKLADNYASIPKIKNEIKKCEIRCCNCHRIRTQEQLGWKSALDWLNIVS
jgi:hypothetical protein